MALRTTLQETIQMVRNECGLSSNTSRGIDHLDHIKQLIKRNYYALSEDYDWQHLCIERDSPTSRVVMQKGERYYDFPGELNPIRITGAWVKLGSTWSPLEYGITYIDRSCYDPDVPQESSPVMNWCYHNDNQFEVWPVPSQNGTANSNDELAFEGQKKVEQLLADNSRMDMDDMLISLMVSAELLTEAKKVEASQVKGQAAQARFQTLRGNMANKGRYVVGMGRVSQETGWPWHPTYIR